MMQYDRRENVHRLNCLSNELDALYHLAARLFEAECSAFASWTDEEFALHLRLMEKYKRALRAEIDKWKGTIHETANSAL